jgi:hypothetical protein
LGGCSGDNSIHTMVVLHLSVDLETNIYHINFIGDLTAHGGGLCANESQAHMALKISAPALAPKIQKSITSQSQPLIANKLASCGRCDLVSKAYLQSDRTKEVELKECVQHEELLPMPSLRSVDRP